MKKIVSDSFFASINLGLEIGYNQIRIEEKNIYAFVSKYQEELISKKNIYLSASFTNFTVVFSGQIEPHLKISFMNYPKFPSKRQVLKDELQNLTKELMLKFNQNRVVIEFDDETVLFEISEEIDPRIKIDG